MTNDTPHRTPRPNLIRVGESDYVSADVIDWVDAYNHTEKGWCVRTKAQNAWFFWPHGSEADAVFRAADIADGVNAARQYARCASRA